MGVTFELIMADDSNVEDLGIFRIPWSPEGSIVTKILDPVALSQLQHIVTSQEYEDAIAYYLDEPLYGDDKSDVWIHKLPDEFVIKLAELNENEIKRFAEAWAKTEEIQLWGLDETFVQELLRDIRLLAAKVIETGKTLFLRSSL